MKVRALSMFAMMVCSSQVHAKEANVNPTAPKHTVFAEAFGAGIGYIANYEYRLRPKLSLRGGLGYSFSTGIGEGEYANVVASVSYIQRLGGAHNLELSPGVGALKEIGGDRTSSMISLLGGYRYQPVEGGFFFRFQLGIGSWDRPEKDRKTIVLPGLALGWSLP